MSTLIQRSFSGGEIAPALYARVDTSKYVTGLRTCRNCFVMRHGGVANRAGTEFVGEIFDSASTVRTIEFIFNSDQAYCLEFGPSIMRVIRNGVYITLPAKTITGVTQATEAVVTSAAHGYSNGNEIVISTVVGMTQLNGRNFRVSDVTTNTFKIKYADGTYVNSTAFGAYTSGGTAEKIFSLATPYAEDALPDLQYVQSADVLTITHPDYPPHDVSRLAHDSWDITETEFVPSIGTPQDVQVAGTAGSTGFYYYVTATSEESGEEGLAGTTMNVGLGIEVASGPLADPGTSTPHTITWDPVTGASEYTVYLRKGNSTGFIGTTQTETFVNDGITPDLEVPKPEPRNPFDGTNNYPSAVAYIQQRRMFANTYNFPERCWGSRTARFTNFTISRPLQDDDAVTFTIAGRQVNAVKHLIDIGKLVAFTTAGEWSIEGGDGGAITPTSINPKQYSYNGSSRLRPLVIGGNALYVQARGSIVRDLGFDYQSDGYRGNDLTIFSAHLVDGYSLVDWAYQQTPHSIVWAVRDDGVLLGLTYVREHQLLAWHRHDMDGFVENVCVVPEGDVDAVYIVVRREIDGRSVRMIERMADRRVDDIKDCIFMDSAISFDGRNTDDAHTMTLSGSGWDYQDDLTLTSSAATFAATDIGNSYSLTGADGEVIRFRITAYTSSTVVTGRPHKTVPASLQATPTSTWTRAVDQLSGLWHLEGKEVSVLADGFVLASPLNPAYDAVVVTDGMITLDRPYGVIRVGLPVTADIETLDIDSTQTETLTDKRKLVGKVLLQMEESRGVWAGGKPPTDDATDPLENLFELKIRNQEGYEDPVALMTGNVEIQILPEWNSNGRVFIRQIDPLPMSLLSVAPVGLFPFRQQGG